MNERVKIWDVVLIVALMAACFLLWFFPKNKGNTVVVYGDQEVVAVGDLNIDEVIRFSDGTQVVIENRTVRIINSTCPDHVCEDMGPISADGEVILCIPNRISVEIRGEEVDAVVG